MKIKNWLAAILCGLLLCLPSPEGAARELRVGVMMSDPQFFSMVKDEEPYGYAFEYMQLLSQYRDWQLIFLPGTVSSTFFREATGSVVALIPSIRPPFSPWPL